METNGITFLSVFVSAILCVSSCNTKEKDAYLENPAEVTVESSDFKEMEPETSNGYYVLASGEGYELLVNQIDSYDKSIVEIGVMKDNKWLVPLNITSPFVTEDGIWRLSAGSDYEYIGNGCFFGFEKPILSDNHNIHVNSIVYSAKTNIGFYDCDFGIYHTFGGVYYGNSPLISFSCENKLYGDKFVAIDNRGKLMLYDLSTGNSKEISGYLTGENFPIEIGAYNEELFYARGKNSSYSGFFNANGDMIINLKDYNISYIDGNNAFENGQVTLICENPNGVEFLVTIDTTGKVIKEERLHK